MRKFPLWAESFKLAAVILLLFLCASSVFASETEGVIDETYQYAWGENIGWLSFGCDNCGVSVTDADLSGFAWSKQYGWINLNPDTSGVKNDGEGTLSGLAWSSNLGWIDFTGVTIDSSGEFTGYATVGSDASSINFNCALGDSCGSADFKVKTDWRPASARQSDNGTSSGSAGGRLRPTPVLPPAIPPPTSPVVGIIDSISEIAGSVWDTIIGFPDFGDKPQVSDFLVQVPENAPPSLSSKWSLLPARAIDVFVFAPLPHEIRVLADKFPGLKKTFQEVGIDRFSDLSRLTGVTLNIPGLSRENEKLIGSVGAGRIALLPGLPIAKFSLAAKKNLPAEFVFARTSGELIDLNVALSFGDKGEVTQRISSLPGKTLNLVVKPISKARSVTGHFVFLAPTPKITRASIYRESLTASALFSMTGLVENAPAPDPTKAEKKLVLSSFEYADADGDGIYTTDVTTPVVPGEYEIITVIDYIDPVLGTRQMRMTTVIDPEGYVFEKTGGKETRIPSAIVSLYHLNVATKKYGLWNAEDYQQENPQITDVRGSYSFLVPEGSYYFAVEAPGYDPYQSNVFVVTEGSGIHQNIELKSNSGFLKDLDWKTILLIVVLLLLMYNLFKDKLSRILKRT